MKISEFFDERKRASAQLVAELEKHMAEWPDAKAKYNAADLECIEIARELSAARLAGSPTAYEIEARLKALRWARAGPTHRHTLRRDELQRAIESYTNEPITNFKLFALECVKDLAKKYRFQKLEGTHDIFSGKRKGWAVRVSHNSAALDAAKTRIFELMKEIDGLKYSPLGTVEGHIEKAKNEIRNFDFGTMQVEELTPMQASDLAPQPEKDNFDRGTLMPGGVHIHPQPLDPAVKGLADRVARLEKGE
jgi:hypothetical protein